MVRPWLATLGLTVVAGLAGPALAALTADADCRALVAALARCAAPVERSHLERYQFLYGAVAGVCSGVLVYSVQLWIQRWWSARNAWRKTQALALAHLRIMRDHAELSTLASMRSDVDLAWLIKSTVEAGVDVRRLKRLLDLVSDLRRIEMTGTSSNTAADLQRHLSELVEAWGAADDEPAAFWLRAGRSGTSGP